MVDHEKHQQNGYSNHENNNNIDNDYLFDINKLDSILKSHATEDSKLNGNFYDSKYLIRPLSRHDYDLGFIDLLRQLTECGTITREQFGKRFDEMKQCPDTYFVLVLEDSQSMSIVGTATLLCEKKFIRQLGLRARIEDVVVDQKCRGQQLGKLLVELLSELSRLTGCYKISLECKDHLVKFYKQCGYDHEDKQNYLCQRF